MQTTSVPAIAQASEVLDERHTVTAEDVARVVAAIPTIGEACDTLRKAGWRASIAGNRITVDDAVYAQFIGGSQGTYGWIGATWVVHRSAGTAPVWVVGAERRLDVAP